MASLRWFAFGAAVAPSLACTSDSDCSLLGVCTDGSCRCDAGWAGQDCARADLEPWTEGHGYFNESLGSWGGRPIQDQAGSWHLFAAEMALGCPLALWQNNSLIVRAVSQSGPLGPYVKAEEVYPVFHHNPTILGPTGDGHYLMFFIGDDRGAETAVDCSAGLPQPTCAFPPDSCMPLSADYISMAWSKSPEGPWQRRVITPRNHVGNLSHWDCRTSNPAPLLLPNGSVVLIYRANACNVKGEEYLGIAVAEHWTEDFVRQSTPVLGPKDGFGNNEDPFFWADARGNYHIVTHQQNLGNVCGNGTNPYDRIKGVTCGGHLYSQDLKSWGVSTTPTYTDELEFANGTKGYLKTRQRPQLIFNADGSPRVLYNGASFDGENNDLEHLTHTFAWRFRSRGSAKAIVA